jgi:hypothetical protein
VCPHKIMKPSSVQRFHSLLKYMTAGFLGVAGFVGTVSGAITAISPSITVVGCAVTIIVWVAAEIFVRTRKPVITWAGQQEARRVTRLGILPRMWLTGALALFLLPRLWELLPSPTDPNDLMTWKMNWSAGCLATPRVMPEFLDPARDQAAVLSYLAKVKITSEFDTLPAVDSPGSISLLDMKITSKVRGTDRIQLFPAVTVNVSGQAPIAQHVNAITLSAPTGCGKDYIRRFAPTVPLRATGQSYEEKARFPDPDAYFTLQSGEFEQIYLSFTCATLGTYTVTVELPYQFMEKQGKLSFSPLSSHMCPASYTVWPVSSDMHFGTEHTYVWNGSGYEKQR